MAHESVWERDPRDGGALMGVLDDYAPTQLDVDTWASIEPVVAKLLDAVDDELTARARHALARVAAYAQTRGHEVTADLLLRDELWAMWLAAEVAPTSAPTYRSALRALAAARGVELSGATGVLGRTSRIKRVYMPDEIDAMLDHAARLSTPLARGVASTLVLCGAGAGLDGYDLSDMTPEAFRRHRGLLLVDVAGSRQARTVAVLQRYADQLEQRVASMPPGQLLMGSASRRSVTDRALRHFTDWGGVRVTARDLRRTWIATLYDAAVRPDVICQQAGVTSMRALDELLDLESVDVELACALAASALPAERTGEGRTGA